MSMRYLFSVTILMAALGAKAWAGAEKGNGGSGVVCFGHQETRTYVEQILTANQSSATPQDPLVSDVLSDITSVELLDIYTAQRSGLPPANDPVISSTGSYLDVLNDRMALIGQKGTLDRLILRSRNAIPESSWISSENGVLAVNDTANVILLPANCILLQIAVRSASQVFYDSRLFSRMNSVNQAALLLHEWLYFYAVKRGQTDSRNTRALVGTIFKRSFASMPGREFSELASQLNFTDAPVPAREILPLPNGDRISIWVYDASKSVEYHDSGALRSARISAPYKTYGIDIPEGSIVYFTETGQLLYLKPSTSLTIQGIECRPGDQYEWGFGISFYPGSGKLFRCIASKKATYFGVKIRDSLVSFYEDGTFRGGILDGDQVVQGLYAGSYFRDGSLISGIETHDVVPGANQDIEFYRSGKLKNIFLIRDQKIQSRKCTSLETAFFDEGGTLTDCRRLFS